MNSSEKKDGNTTEGDSKTPVLPDDSYDQNYDQWEEWYDDNEFENKRAKIRRSKKRLYKNREEW
tara:strand:- start:143 stop:334 length:192 start_codon:yes stop_codon:yes gene_type:complete